MIILIVPSPPSCMHSLTRGLSCWYMYRIAGNFQKVFIFGYFEEAFLFENKFSRLVVLRK